PEERGSGLGVERLPAGLDRLEPRAHAGVPRRCAPLRPRARRVPSLRGDIEDDASHPRARWGSRTRRKRAPATAAGFLVEPALVAALACGLVAGFFFAFSTTVMKALTRVPESQGLTTMQTINVVVINPLVMLALFGTGVACAVLVTAAFVEWGEPYAVYLLLGGLVYLTGVVVLTFAYHVPRND